MSHSQPKTVTYRARCYYAYGKVTWYLGFDWDRAKWCWTKDAKCQRSFDDYGEVINAIAEAGGPDRGDKPSPGGWAGNRNVIIETDTHEEQEFSSMDHFRWQRAQSS